MVTHMNNKIAPIEVYGNFFDEYMQTHGFDNTLNLVHIEIELIRICQQKCLYCFARNDKMPWNTMLSHEHLSSVIKEMEHSVSDLRVSLMGGEPSLYPNIATVMRNIASLDKVREVEIFTNALKRLDLDDNQKYSIVCSYHPRDCKDLDTFKSNIKYYSTKHKKVLVYLMTILDPDSFSKIKQMKLFCEENGIRCCMEYIFDNAGNLERYLSLDANDYAEYKKMEMESRYVVVNNKKYTADEFYRKDLNHFKGMKCYASRLLKLEIRDPSNFRIECAKSVISVPVRNYLRKEICPIVCKHNTCVTLASISKYKHV